MNHLTEEELVDVADGTLAEERRAHLRGCDNCREQAVSMGTLLARVAAVQVPEPSPLFWDHLSRRITDAVSAPAPQRRGWLGSLARPASAWAAGLISLSLVAALSFSLNRAPDADPPVPVSHRTAVEELQAPSDWDDIEADQAWALVRTVAEDVGWDEAHAAGLAVRPGAAEGIAVELSWSEQSELALLIEAELKGSGA
jgi:hypothetical protein